jgi:hypothetical protein
MDIDERQASEQEDSEAFITEDDDDDEYPSDVDSYDAGPPFEPPALTRVSHRLITRLENPTCS